MSFPLCRRSKLRGHVAGTFVSFHDGSLEFARGVATVRVPAVGTWPGAALVSADLMTDLLRRGKALPENFVLSGGKSMLHFSHYSIPCSWAASSAGS